MPPPVDAAAHYALFPARAAILAALARRGADIEHLTPERLAPFDHLHTGGVAATRALIARLAPRAQDHVLDVGSGLGGPARLLAAVTGCRVTGIDLTPRFVDDASDLTARTGQAERVTFHLAPATALPFAAGTFDAAWHLHVAMNVADKAAMYGEIFRVLKPGARLAIDDPVRGEGDIRFPLPWAATAEASYLWNESDLAAQLRASGFVDLEIVDVTDQGLAWFASIQASRKTGGAPTPLEVLGANHHANLISGAVRIVSVLARKP